MNAVPRIPKATTVLVFCSHEPELDPRIDWIARYSPEGIRRTVVGLADSRRPKPPVENLSESYSVLRAERTGLFSSALVLASHFFRFAPIPYRVVAFLTLVVLGLPLLVVYEVLNLAYNVATLVMTGDWSALPRRSFIVGAWSWVGQRLWNAGPSKAAVISTRQANPVLGVLKAVRLERLPMFAAMLIHFLQVNAALVASSPARERGYRLVHANDLDTLGAAVLLKWETGCRVVYDAHEYWPYADLGASRAEQRFWAALERFLVRYADAAFTVSKPLAQALQAETGCTFLDVPNAEPAHSVRELRPASHHPPLRFLFLGTFAPGRGLEELLDGWNDLKEPALQLHFRGPEGPEKDRLRELAESRGLAGRTVHFEPSVHESELVACAAEYDVGIIPYKPISLGYRYCCPNKLSQYMQAGVAILTNNLVYVKHIVERFECGLSYDSDHLETLVGAARAFGADRRALQAMKRNAILAAQREFNWQKQSVPLYEAYERLA